MTIVKASKEQADKLLSKHLSKVISKSFVSDDETDKNQYVELKTSTKVTVQYKLSNNIYWVDFDFRERTIRYSIHDLKAFHREMHDLLKKYGEEAKTEFWKGGEI